MALLVLDFRKAMTSRENDGHGAAGYSAVTPFYLQATFFYKQKSGIEQNTDKTSNMDNA